MSIVWNQDASNETWTHLWIKVSGPVSAMEAFCCSKLLPATDGATDGATFFIHHTHSPYDLGIACWILKHVMCEARPGLTLDIYSLSSSISSSSSSSSPSSSSSSSMIDSHFCQFFWRSKGPTIGTFVDLCLPLLLRAASAELPKHVLGAEAARDDDDDDADDEWYMMNDAWWMTNDEWWWWWWGGGCGGGGVVVLVITYENHLY